MQHAGKTVEIGHSCFAMNIKGGRGFPWISLHNPMKWCGRLVLINRETNEKQMGVRSLTVLWSGEEGAVWGLLGASVWENVGVRGIERWLSGRMNGVEWMKQLCITDRDPAVSVTKRVKNWIVMCLIQTALQCFLSPLHWQPGCIHGMSAACVCTAHLSFLLFIFFPLSWHDEVRQSPALSLASSLSLFDLPLVEDNTL